MREIRRGVVGMLAGIAVAGCHAATRVADYPRVDLQVDGAGNRGYLVGTPPYAPELQTSRQMIHPDVEVPSFYRPKKGAQPPAGDVAEMVAPDDAASAQAGRAQARAGEAADSYVVQKGDSLWSIAKKPEVYGSAAQWRKLFDANRDVLKSPNHVRVGMTLKVPRGGSGGAEESTTYIK